MSRADNRSGSTMRGVLLVDKPPGVTAMRAVSLVRARAGGAKTGHAGTLDPLATGLLVLALGKATRHLGAFMNAPKCYRTVIDLSAVTASGDLESERVEVEVRRTPDEATVRSTLDQFVGAIQQTPPAFSAVKTSGRRAYTLARAGKPVALEPRTVRVDRIDLESYHWPLLELDLRCGKGFYVRSLARDLGQALGTGGHCTSICRTAIGPFLVTEAIALPEVPDPLTQEHLTSEEDALRRLTASSGSMPDSRAS